MVGFDRINHLSITTVIQLVLTGVYAKVENMLKYNRVINIEILPFISAAGETIGT